MEIILAIATVLGGITAIWFLIEKFSPRWKTKHKPQLTTLKDLLPILEAKKRDKEPFSLVELLDSLGFSRMEVDLLRKVASFPDYGGIISANSGNYLKDQEIEIAKQKLIRRGFLVDDANGHLQFSHKTLKEYGELI